MIRVADLFVANLPSEGNRAKRDDKEEIGNVGLDALPVQDLTFTRAEGEIMYIGAHCSSASKGPTHSQVS